MLNKFIEIPNSDGECSLHLTQKDVKHMRDQACKYIDRVMYDDQTPAEKLVVACRLKYEGVSFLDKTNIYCWQTVNILKDFYNSGKQ